MLLNPFELQLEVAGEFSPRRRKLARPKISEQNFSTEGTVLSRASAQGGFLLKAHLYWD